MAIRQVTTSNTFLQWLIATQALVDAYNYYEVRTNLVFDAANSVSNTANAVYATNVKVQSTATDIYQYVSTAYNSANNISLIANNAYNTANLAYALSNAAVSNLTLANAIANTSIKANLASNTANSAWITANSAYLTANGAFIRANLALEVGNTIWVNDNTNNNTFFVTFLASNTNIANGAFQTSAKLTYNPFTGTINSVDFNSTSDARLKENLKNISGLDLIEQINPYQFTWKETGKKSYGVLAQEAENILPELVNEREDGYKGFSYIPLIAILIQSIKELNDKIKELENK